MDVDVTSAIGFRWACECGKREIFIAVECFDLLEKRREFRILSPQSHMWFRVSRDQKNHEYPSF